MRVIAWSGLIVGAIAIVFGVGAILTGNEGLGVLTCAAAILNAALASAYWRGFKRGR